MTHETVVHGFDQSRRLPSQILTTSRVSSFLHCGEEALLGSHSVLKVVTDLGKPLRYVLAPTGAAYVAPRLFD
jgi:hypothetical protein